MMPLPTNITRINGRRTAGQDIQAEQIMHFILHLVIEAIELAKHMLMICSLLALGVCLTVSGR